MGESDRVRRVADEIEAAGESAVDVGTVIHRTADHCVQRHDSVYDRGWRPTSDATRRRDREPASTNATARNIGGVADNRQIAQESGVGIGQAQGHAADHSAGVAGDDRVNQGDVRADQVDATRGRDPATARMSGVAVD